MSLCEFLPQINGRGEKHEGIAGEVDEFRVGEAFQDGADSRGVRGRLQDDGLLIFDRQRFDEIFKGVEPFVLFLFREIAQSEIFVVDLIQIGKRDVAIGRAHSERADSEFVFLRTIETDFHVVHGALLRHKKLNPWGHNRL